MTESTPIEDQLTGFRFKSISDAARANRLSRSAVIDSIRYGTTVNVDGIRHKFTPISNINTQKGENDG